MVAVFREVKRVLRDDGTLWLNLGSSYFGGERGGASFKPKDMVPIPWMVAMALQADGWYLRQDIIWAKPNPMPESVTDRCTKSHEYIFMLTKSARYYYDADAIKEPSIYYEIDSRPSALERGRMYDYDSKEKALGRVAVYKDEKSFDGKHSDKQRGHGRRHAGFNDRWDAMEKTEQCGAMRNKRSVWTVATRPFSGAHFATFPPKLIEPCILAGTSAHGHCRQCGDGWTRIVEKGSHDLDHQRACGGDINGEYHGEAVKEYAGTGAQNASATKARILEGMRERITVGWQPACKCDSVVVPGVVLDPFMGSGTTAMVAQSFGRNYIGCELNREYEAMQADRTKQLGMAL